MALVSLRQLLDDSAEYGYGIPAFNVNNMEGVLSILAAADKVGAPVIIQASKGARQYANDAVLKHLMMAGVEMYPHLPICVHQDHGSSPEVCYSAMAAGFTSVMMDGSLDAQGNPATYEYNANTTQTVVNTAHPAGVSVEGELGCIGSLETGKGEKEDGHGFDGALDKSKLLTDPDQAVDFVRQTKVDALAVAIGTSHGAYKFKPGQNPKLRLDILDEIARRLPGFPIVLHGASSVPQDYVKIINEHGGNMPDAIGIPEDQLREAAKRAVCKINIDSDLRLGMTAAIRLHFATHPDHFDPRQYLTDGRNNVRNVVTHKIKNVLGSENKA
jgi:fructose-bisphosphate aldolase class II